MKNSPLVAKNSRFVVKNSRFVVKNRLILASLTSLDSFFRTKWTSPRYDAIPHLLSEMECVLQAFSVDFDGVRI